MGNKIDPSADNVELDATDGKAFIGQASPLTRLHYFDGQFLRADAFALEQDYHRKQVQLANIAGGWGAVNGLGIGLTGSVLNVGAGLAITPAGNFVLAPADIQATLDELLKVAVPSPVSGSASFADCVAPKAVTAVTAALAVYEITVGPISGLCGNEPVYGKLCASACASDSDRPYWREGVVLRLRPIGLKLPSSNAVTAAVVHLRNRIVSGYFANEPGQPASIVSAAGLAGGVWCEPAALYGRDEVVIGLLALEGGVARVIDAWSGRRERMDTQPRSYWQGRMAMRPWNVFIAQILQFQCQLSGLFTPGKPVMLPADDCDRLRALLTKTRQELETLVKRYGDSTKKILLRTTGKTTPAELQSVATDMTASFADIDSLSSQLVSAESGQGALPKQRMLIAAGFFELPPAGYLPVDPSGAVADQVQRMFGEGVRLHYHAVRHDEIAHLLEEAQHMERISLTRGLDNAEQLEEVEIFVPDGQVSVAALAVPGIWWQTEFPNSSFQVVTGGANDLKAAIVALNASVKGAATGAARRAGRAAASNAATAPPDPTAELLALIVKLADAIEARPFEGLSRTEARDDGSFGITMVVRCDVDDILATIRDWVAQHPDFVVPPRFATLIANAASVAVSLVADIDHDPLQLPIGEQASVKLEMRVLGDVSTASGTLTPMQDRTAPDGAGERVVQLKLVTVDDATGAASVSSSSIALERQSTANGGRLIEDDALHDPKSSPTWIEWDTVPRRAAIYQLSATAATSIATRLIGTLMKPTAPAPAGGVARRAVARPAAGLLDAQGRQLQVAMTGLTGMPALTSAIGAEAMNALVRIGTLADDAAFVARMQRRLFPVLAAPSSANVVATLDWLMFRRARTLLCCPNPPAVAGTALEAIQLWHMEVTDAAALKELQAALDSDDATRLAPFAFEPVGVLRYRDDQVLAEEPASSVAASWSVVIPATPGAPASQVVLGRYWEVAPQTGQGWQNRFRLSAMLDQIKLLAKPPAAGDGSIAPLANLASPLLNRSVDGGMLVVTMKVGIQKRNALLIIGTADGADHYPPNGTPQAALEFDNNAPVGNALVAFIKALPSGATYYGFTLATTAADPDAGAVTRMATVVAAWTLVGRPLPANGLRQHIVRLSTHDHDWLLKKVLIKAEDYDEIIFFE